MEKFLTTSEFAKELGVAKNTVVNWEQKGLLLPHHITPTGRRYYSQKQLDKYLKKGR